MANWFFTASLLNFGFHTIVWKLSSIMFQTLHVILGGLSMLIMASHIDVWFRRVQNVKNMVFIESMARTITQTQTQSSDSIHCRRSTNIAFTHDSLRMQKCEIFKCFVRDGWPSQPLRSLIECIHISAVSISDSVHKVIKSKSRNGFARLPAHRVIYDMIEFNGWFGYRIFVRPRFFLLLFFFSFFFSVFFCYFFIWLSSRSQLRWPESKIERASGKRQKKKLKLVRLFLAYKWMQMTTVMVIGGKRWICLLMRHACCDNIEKRFQID